MDKSILKKTTMSLVSWNGQADGKSRTKSLHFLLVWTFCNTSSAHVIRCPTLSVKWCFSRWSRKGLAQTQFVSPIQSSAIGIGTSRRRRFFSSLLLPPLLLSCLVPTPEISTSLVPSPIAILWSPLTPSFAHCKYNMNVLTLTDDADFTPCHY